MSTSLSDFLITTGRTLSQMALYSPAHPTVKDAIKNAHASLAKVLESSDELTLFLEEGKILVNGQSPEGVSEAAVRPFVQLFTIFNLYSLTFKKDIGPQELIPFFELAYDKNLKQNKPDVSEFFHSRGAPHIQANQAKYAKISEDQVIGQADKKEEEAPAKSDEDFLSQLENLPLDQFLKSLIQKAVRNPEDRNRIFSKISSLIKKEISEAVERETKILRGEKLKATNERDRVEGVVGRMAEGVVVVDGTGKVLMMNSTAEEMYGVKLGECVGKPLWEGVRQEQMVSLAKETVAPSDRPLVKEFELRGNEETKKTLRSSTAAVQDPDGRVIGMVSVLSDVTKQKELTRLQNEFMANVTHDLRAPIHALKLAVYAILEEAAGPVTDEQKRMLGMAGRNVDRLTRLIDDLLDFSAIESGKLKIQPAILEPAPILQEAAQSFESWSKSRGVNIKFEPEKDLWSVYADGDRVLQILSNLVSNAIKFTPSGGSVTIRASNTDVAGKRMVKINVEDTGKGIDKEDQKRIFSRFVQLQNEEKLDVRGTGLGLSITQALIHQHQGQMGLASPPPSQAKGSLFWFTLPAVESDRGKRPPDHGNPSGPAPVEPKRQEKPDFWKKIFSRLKLSALILVLAPSLLLARPFHGKVRRVLEGDRLQLQDGTIVRFLGIDLPDVRSPYYPEASAASRRWVKGKDVVFRYGLQERTVEGTWQAYVFVDGFFVNEELVRDGHALVTRLNNEEKYLTDLLKAERYAIRKKRGLWRDSTIEPYNLRIQKPESNPWATEEEVRRGKKIPEEAP